MRLKLWAIPAFFGAIVAAIPFEKTYETHLNYFPIDAEDDINSYLVQTDLHSPYRTTNSHHNSL